MNNQYSSGGYIPGGPVPVQIGIAECIMAAADVRIARWRCSRTDPAHLAAAGHADQVALTDPTTPEES